MLLDASHSESWAMTWPFTTTALQDKTSGRRIASYPLVSAPMESRTASPIGPSGANRVLSSMCVTADFKCRTSLPATTGGTATTSLSFSSPSATRARLRNSKPSWFVRRLSPTKRCLPVYMTSPPSHLAFSSSRMSWMRIPSCATMYFIVSTSPLLLSWPIDVITADFEYATIVSSTKRQSGWFSSGGKQIVGMCLLSSLM
mmetsp:Transcript_8687/g.20253  ORF Transcript_8687/g.20253 Transcript_8687/m.20253 type:complete len:201 (+) Transcript_8687:556-1158(+)